MYECQAMRWSRDPALRSISALKYLGGPGHRLLAGTNRRERAGQISDHVLQKRICDDVECDPVTVAPDAQRR